MKKLFLILMLLSAATCQAADNTLGYEEGSAINQDIVRDQWQQMRDQPELTEGSGIRDPFQEFFKLNTQRAKPVAKPNLAKGKKGKKTEVLDETSKDPSLAAESKVDGKPNLNAKPKVTGTKARSPDGSTTSEY